MILYVFIKFFANKKLIWKWTLESKSEYIVKNNIYHLAIFKNVKYYANIVYNQSLCPKMSFSGKYLAKMFILKKFSVGECILKLFFFCVTVVGNQGYVSHKVYSLKNPWTDCYWWDYLPYFLITKYFKALWSK